MHRVGDRGQPAFHGGGSRWPGMVPDEFRPLLTDAAIRENGGRRGVPPGFVYAEQGRVPDISWSRPLGNLAATVRRGGANR